MLSILDPDEAVPLLLNPSISPVVALDTEFEVDDGAPTCRAPMRGLSMAGGNPRDGIFCTFWPYIDGRQVHPWGYLRDEVIKPIIGDRQRKLVMHPLKVDMQVLRARGLSDEDFLCQLGCTMSLVHIYDENLPKGLKELGQCLLAMHGQLTHAQTQQEIKKIRKQGPKHVKAVLKQCWEHYRDHRKKSKEVEVQIDPSWESWKKLVMELPPKMLKKDVIATLEERVSPVILKHYEDQAVERFSVYGAEDAGMTLGIYYWLMERLDPRFLPLVELETKVCHPIVTEMEENGIRLDLDLLAAMYHVMAQVIENLRADVISRWGMAPTLDDETGETGRSDEEEMNPGSPDQVCRIVWDHWQLRPPKFCIRDGELLPKWRRAKDGYCKVNKDVLSYLADHAPKPYCDHIQKLLDFRRVEKLLGTYVSPMLTRATLDPEQRIHASFWPVGARTGRFSSDEPNVENIPRPNTMPQVPIPPGADYDNPPKGVVVGSETKKGVKKKVWRVASLRDVVIPADDTPIGGHRWKLVSADLAQIENRIIAHESQDPVLIDLFCRWDCATCKQTGVTTEPLHQCPNCGCGEGKRDKTTKEQLPQVKWKCSLGHKGMSPDPAQHCPHQADEDTPPCLAPIVKNDGFCLGKDIHSKSSVAIGLDEKYGPGEGRQRAKAVNHAFNYGMGARTLAQREDIPLKEAKAGLNALDNEYSYVRKYLHTRVRNDVREKGYVTMFDGHRRRFFVARTLLRSGNLGDWEWEGIIREGVNVLAQGGTGIVMKRAMISIRERLRSHPNPLIRKTKLINQVHDELLYEAPEEVAEEVLAIVVWELEHAVQLRVPVIADGAIGSTWGEAH